MSSKDVKRLDALLVKEDALYSEVVFKVQNSELLLSLPYEVWQDFGEPEQLHVSLSTAPCDPEIFPPRDPHTYVTHEPPSSGAETPDERNPSKKGDSRVVQSSPPAPDDIGPVCDGSFYCEATTHIHGCFAEGDIGPPAPGEGDDLPNPEVGMEC